MRGSLTFYLTVPGHLCPAFQLPVEVMGVDWPGKDISTMYVLVRLAEGCYECMKPQSELKYLLYYAPLVILSLIIL